MAVSKLLAAEQRNDKVLAKIILALEQPPSEEESKEAVVAEVAPEEIAAQMHAQPDAMQKAIRAKRVKQYMLVGEHRLLAKAVTLCKCSRSADDPKLIVRAYSTYWPIVVPRTMIPAIFHGDTSALGHTGKHKTFGTIKTRFTWKGQMASIRRWLGTCHKCLRRKRVVPKHQRYTVHDEVRAPFNKVAIDIVGPLKRTTKGNAYILTIYDTFSHWPSAYPLPSTKAKLVVNCLKHYISVHSVPATILSDRGKNFLAQEVQRFLDLVGTNKMTTTPYKPSSNGSVERFNAYLAQAISHAVSATMTTGTHTLTVFSLRTALPRSTA